MDDGVYYGEVDQNSLKEGKGAIFYHNGKVYEGQFKNDVKEGQVLEQFLDCSVYSGHFKNGKINVKGTIAFVEQEPIIFSGTIKDNIVFGK